MARSNFLVCSVDVRLSYARAILSKWSLSAWKSSWSRASCQSAAMVAAEAAGASVVVCSTGAASGAPGAVGAASQATAGALLPTPSHLTVIILPLTRLHWCRIAF